MCPALSKVCKKLGKTDAAMRHFTIALDLHNKVPVPYKTVYSILYILYTVY